MIRSRSHLALAVALGAAALACTKAASNPAGVRLRQPTSIAVFQGRTLQNPTPGGTVHPYLAVANAALNDLAIVDAVTDQPVASPIKLRTLVYPAGERPTLVAAASLGDDGPTLDTRQPDLLVAVSGGDSALQVVDTWDGTDRDPVRSDHDFGPGREIVALAAVPSAPGTARIAAILADARVAVVTYRRVAGDANGAIEQDPLQPPVVRSTPLPFRPLAIAAMPDDGDPGNGIQTALYLATQDEIEPGIFGVAELSADDVDAAPRALGARGPTRLVAALRLRERFNDPADAARSAASDGTAFEGQPVAQRVYAVLDESGCGPAKRIDCGVVALDPTIAAPPASIPQAIPPDWAGLMPYRAPMRVNGRPLALPVSGPPALVPAPEGTPPIDYTSLMRLHLGTIPRATTGVAAVPSDDGNVYFLDLGRFETVTSGSVLSSRSTGTPTASTVSPDPSDTRVVKDRRLWLQTPLVVKTDANGNPVTVPDGAFLNVSDLFEQYAAVVTTPGFTRDETWTVTYQGYLSNDLVNRVGEVGLDAGTSQLWLALQLGDRSGGGSPTLTQVARLWHPDLGVAPGDILVFKAAGVPVPTASAPTDTPPGPCVGKLPNVPPGIDASLEFELRVSALLPPSADHPGGAVTLAQPDGSVPEWLTCYDALQWDVAHAATGVVSPLLATLRAQELVLLGRSLGYGGRPLLGQPETNPTARTGGIRKPFALAYPTTTDEDQLAAACPLADWDGTYPPADPAILTCDESCRAACETLVLARKARRIHNLSEDCSTDPNLKTSCATQTTNTVPALWPPAQFPFPFVNGPALAFSVAVQYSGSQPNPPATDAPVRDMSLRLLSQSGVGLAAARQSGTSPYQANDAVAFDRTPWVDAGAGYRFFVSYPADFVLDATPSQSGAPVPSSVIK